MTYRVTIKTDINDYRKYQEFDINAASPKDIRKVLGYDIDVASFLTWYGCVDLVNGKLIDDGREIPKRRGEIRYMYLLNIKECPIQQPDITDISTYEKVSHQYDFTLDEIYDIDWKSIID